MATFIRFCGLWPRIKHRSLGVLQYDQMCTKYFTRAFQRNFHSGPATPTSTNSQNCNHRGLFSSRNNPLQERTWIRVSRSKHSLAQPQSQNGSKYSTQFYNLCGHTYRSRTLAVCNQSSSCPGVIHARYYSSVRGGSGDGSGSAPSSAGGGDGGDGDGNDDRSDSGYNRQEGGDSNREHQEYQASSVALTPMIIPDVFPCVPMIAVRRNPCFPRFIKMMEVWIWCFLSMILF